MRRLACLIALSLAAVAAPVSAYSASGAAAEQGTVEPGAVKHALQAIKAPQTSPAPVQVQRAALARFGPFAVLDAHTAALVGSTDARSPGAFRDMLAAYPRITTLTFVECPGTYDDRANLALGRMIRAAGLAAIVPDGGSVRSGAVELVLAGTRVRIEDGAEFAVHAWEDQDGREAADYAPDSIEHRKYLAYYREMGMTPATAAAFYAMTNSVPFETPLWLGGAQMRDWVGPSAAFAPRLAYLDLGLALY